MMFVVLFCCSGRTYSSVVGQVWKLALTACDQWTCVSQRVHMAMPCQCAKRLIWDNVVSFCCTRFAATSSYSLFPRRRKRYLVDSNCIILYIFESFSTSWLKSVSIKRVHRILSRHNLCALWMQWLVYKMANARLLFSANYFSTPTYNYTRYIRTL